jgi:hypothetical protein
VQSNLIQTSITLPSTKDGRLLAKKKREREREEEERGKSFLPS